jgi:collagen type V/XI/XXIV/XXVII alpha
VEEVIEKVTEEIFGEIDELREDLNMLRYPRGTKESPARSCRDIKVGFPDSADGRF